MEPSTLWWITAGVLAVVEMLTGTLYILMLAAGAAAAAIAAHLGLPSHLQWFIAALTCLALWFLIHRKKASQQASNPQTSPDVQSDIGSIVQVSAWTQAGHQWTTRVQHRGTLWAARLQAMPDVPSEPPVATSFAVSGLEGNTLVLKPLPPFHTP